MSRWRSPFPLVAALAVALKSSAALATDCEPAGGVSPCFEADPLRIPPAHAHFAAIASPEVTPSGQAAFSLASSFVYRPLVLNAPSPAPEGRDVLVVERELGVIVGLGVGLGKHFELSASMPASVARQGSGVEGITSQRAEPLPRTAVRDPRVGVSWSYLMGGATRFGVEPRLELSLPFGDEAALAGYAGPGLLPAVAAELLHGPFRFGAEIAARLGQAVDFATTRQGSELFLGAGAAVAALDEGLLDVSAELWLRPSLESTPERSAATAETSGPAGEWLLGLRSSQETFSIFVGGGQGLALATERHAGAEHTVFAPTAPAFRGVVVLRHTPAP